MGFLHIGQNVMVNDRRIIGIFDLDITSQSAQTRRFPSRRPSPEGNSSSMSITQSTKHWPDTASTSL